MPYISFNTIIVRKCWHTDHTHKKKNKDKNKTKQTAICFCQREILPTEFQLKMPDLTLTQFTTEGAVKPLTTVLPAHRRAHGGSTPTTTHNTLWLFAHWQGFLQVTKLHTHIPNQCTQFCPQRHVYSEQVSSLALQSGFTWHANIFQDISLLVSSCFLYVFFFPYTLLNRL